MEKATEKHYPVEAILFFFNSNLLLGKMLILIYCFVFGMLHEVVKREVGLGMAVIHTMVGWSVLSGTLERHLVGNPEVSGAWNEHSLKSPK